MNRKLVGKSNYVLRRILNKEENMDIVKDIIESMFEVEISKISLKPYLKECEKYLPAEENYGVVDVRIELNTGEKQNIGIQFIDGLYYADHKMLIYYAQIHNYQLEYQWIDKAEITKTINIMDFNYGSSIHYFNKIGSELEHRLKIPDDIEIYYLELPKLRKTGSQIQTKKEAWVAYLKGEKIENIDTKFGNIHYLDKLLNVYWLKEVME